jgi:large subunit ribosomal protein L24
MHKIKKNDLVVVITGKSKGVQGKVLRVINGKTDKTGKSRTKVLVEGANLVKKHVKPNPNTNTTGGIEREASMDVSNVAIFNPVTKKADKVGFKTLEDGRKVRYFKSNDELVDI